MDDGKRHVNYPVIYIDTFVASNAFIEHVKLPYRITGRKVTCNIVVITS